MSNVDFCYHPITTETLIYSMEGIVDLRMVIFLCPIDYEFLWKSEMNIGQKKPPSGSKPSSVLLMKFDNQGECLNCGFNNGKGAFKNAITMSISTEVKNNNIKICPKRIQLTGAKSFDNGKESIMHYLNHVLEIDNLIREMNFKSEMRDSTLNWLEQWTKGPPYILFDEEGFPRIEHYLVQPSKEDLDLAEAREIIDRRYADLLLNKVRDYRLERHPRIDYMFDDVHSDYVQFLKTIPNKKCVILERPYKLSDMHIGTININYNLGFLINRHLLDKCIYKYKGFISRFINTIEDKCEIQLEC